MSNPRYPEKLLMWGAFIKQRAGDYPIRRLCLTLKSPS